ncbi:hypothetical protein NM208_g4639 [Fusarium decemcellulare]|uniref:Uncharacterized protein n=1 Tax=Fusarium decemcellulare TaxID=57161 RepID=A0ACC1SK36_9HYPO|nr:hypothetical protein NM208_g4639 [Fusarium decemcellulare]
MLDHTLILHPSVSHFVRFISTILGRDKLMRLLQFSCRLRLWALSKENSSAVSVERWESLSRNLGLTRKLLRFGKNIEQFQAAALTLGTKSEDYFLRDIAIIRQLLAAAYLTCDNATILNSLGFYTWKSARSIERQASKLWLSTVICSIITQLYCFHRLKQYKKSARTSVGPETYITL